MARISDTTTLIEENAANAPAKDLLWNAQKIETEGVQIIDPGVGKEVVLRHFFFKAQPMPKGTPRLDKHQIVSQFKRLIEMSLWGDGLIIREDKSLEVHTLQKAKKISKALYLKMRQEGSDFVIMCLATPRAGVNVTDTVRKI